MFFPESADSWADVLLTDRNNWTQAMKDALGLHQDGGFPFRLSLNNSPRKPIPAVDFSEDTAKHWRCLEQRAKDLPHTDRIPYHQVQTAFQRHKDTIYNREIW